MPIDVICPKCHSKLRAPDEVVGKNVRCKKCQEKFKVPNPGAPVDSVGDTQMLSVVEMPLPLGKTSQPEAIPLDDSAFEDPIPSVVKAAAPLPKPTEELIVEDDDRPKKKKKREEDDEEDDERPKKKKRRDEDEEEDRPRKKKEKPLIGGEPTFAMPGAAEDPAPVVAPPPPHVGQFAFDAPEPTKSKSRDEDDDEEDRPKKKKKKRDDDEDDDRPAPKGKKKSNKLLYILGGIAAVLFLGCAGVAAGAYFFVIKTADAISKATINVAPTTATKPETKAPTTRPTKPTTTGNEPVPMGPPVTPFVVPTGLQNGTVVAAGTQIPLPFSADFVKQLHGFVHPTAGPMLLAIHTSNPGFNGTGSEDTVVRFDLGKKALAGEFVIPADGLAGTRIFDVSDSGDRVAIEAPKGRLTVYNFADKMADIPIDVHAGLPQREGIVGIAFSDAPGTRVAIVDKLGAVDVWDIKERQRVFTGTPDPGKVNIVVERRKPEYGMGLVASKGWLKRVDWSNGRFEPAVKLPVKTGSPTLVAAQEKQDRHTAIVHIPDGSSEREVLVVNQAGVAVWRVPLPAAVGIPRTLRWIQNDSILAVGFDAANGMVLLDFASKYPSVYIKPAQEKTLLGDAGDFSVLPNPKMPTKAALVQAPIPANALATMVEAAKNNKSPERVYAKPEGLNQ